MATEAQPAIGWLDLKRLVVYSSVSNRTLRTWIRRPRDPLPASQVGNKILVWRDDFDQWVRRQRVKPIDVGAIVDDIVSSFGR